MHSGSSYTLILFDPNGTKFNGSLTFNPVIADMAFSGLDVGPDFIIEGAASFSPLSAEFTLGDSDPIKMAGWYITFEKPGQPCIQLASVDSGESYFIQYGLMQSHGEAIGGSVSASSPAIGFDLVFYGYKPQT